MIKRFISFRSQLACGINQVTRVLEKNELSVLLVEKSVPQLMIRHLIPLSTLKQCPTICVSGLKEQLSAILGVTSLAAFGIKVRLFIFLNGSKYLIVFLYYPNYQKLKDYDCKKFENIRNMIRSYSPLLPLENVGLHYREANAKGLLQEKINNLTS